MDLEDIRASLRRGAFPDEASVSQGIVLRLLSDLGWPAFDTRHVRPQFPVENRRVDFALCHPPGRPAVFVEVKRLGSAAVGERQLFEYAFHLGVPLVVLTDGQQWHFYLPAERGNYEERRVYLLDLLERPVDEAERRLRRYLSFERIASGAALDAARTDYQAVAARREVTRTLPLAWRDLIDEQDSALVDLVADRVETLCGYKPDPDRVAEFLLSLGHGRQPAPPEGPGPHPTPRPKRPAPADPEQRTGFRLHGRWHACSTAREVLIRALTVLAEADPDFLPRFAGRPRHGRTRRFVARRPEELYPNRPDLARDYSHELMPGWWAGTNYGTTQIRDNILRMAAEVAGLKYGEEFVVLVESST